MDAALQSRILSTSLRLPSLAASSSCRRATTTQRSDLCSDSRLCTTLSPRLEVRKAAPMRQPCGAVQDTQAKDATAREPPTPTWSASKRCPLAARAKQRQVVHCLSTGTARTTTGRRTILSRPSRYPASHSILTRMPTSTTRTRHRTSRRRTCSFRATILTIQIKAMETEGAQTSTATRRRCSSSRPSSTTFSRR